MLNLREKNRQWWIFLAMTITMSVITIDVTVLPVILPTLQRTLGFSNLGLQWIVNAHTFTLTAFVMAGGRLGDHLGHCQVLFIEQPIFGIGSILCGLNYHEWFFYSLSRDPRDWGCNALPHCICHRL